jgi:hypothetical protein
VRSMSSGDGQNGEKKLASYYWVVVEASPQQSMLADKLDMEARGGKYLQTRRCTSCPQPRSHAAVDLPSHAVQGQFQDGRLARLFALPSPPLRHPRCFPSPTNRATAARLGCAPRSPSVGTLRLDPRSLGPPRLAALPAVLPASFLLLSGTPGFCRAARPGGITSSARARPQPAAAQEHIAPGTAIHQLLEQARLRRSARPRHFDVHNQDHWPASSCARQLLNGTPSPAGPLRGTCVG